MAAALAAAALEQGGYELAFRSGAGVVLWWAVAAGVLAGLWPRAPLPRAALAAGGLLAALAVLTGLSALWAESAERAWIELGRVTFYAGLFAVVALASRAGDVARWSDGLALGIAFVALVALGERCLPDLVPGGGGAGGGGEFARLLPGSELRLSHPIGYWNGLGALLGMGVPLLLRPAVDARGAWARGLALGALPLVLAALYLTSSRGGALAAAAGAVVLVVAGRRVAASLWALALGGAGGAVAIALLRARDELVDGPLDSQAALDQGESAAVLIALVCAATGLAHALLSPRVVPRLRPGRRAGRAAAVLAALAAAAGIVAADPVDRFERFKRAPDPDAATPEDFVRSHLLSSEGSGRWQFWSSALEEWETRPLAGRGAGSFEAWWLGQGKIDFAVRDAHSLYLETLGELGLLGLALLIGALGAGVAAAVRRLRAPPGSLAVAAAAGAFAGFLASAGFDWIWELPAVGGVGIACLALLTGPASGGSGTGSAAAPRAARPAAALASLAAIGVLALPWLVEREVRESQDAIRAGDLSEALERARAARTLQPWAASPRLQLALVAEAARDLGAARRAIGDAIERDPSDWRLWLVQARILSKSGDGAGARASLERARELNPRSPLFASATPG